MHFAYTRHYPPERFKHDTDTIIDLITSITIGPDDKILSASQNYDSLGSQAGLKAPPLDIQQFFNEIKTLLAPKVHSSHS